MKKSILIVFIFCCSNVSAQLKLPFFNTLSIENGLPEEYVQTSLQDKLGYLWFGTQNGLVRYDGYSTKLYPLPNEDGKPVNAASLSNLFEDKYGVLWLTVRSINNWYYLDRRNDVFKILKTDTAAKGNMNTGRILDKFFDIITGLACTVSSGAAPGETILEIMDLPHGDINQFKPGNKEIILVPKRTKIFYPLTDPSRNLWLATDSLLSKYDRVSKSFKPYFLLPAGMNKIMFKELCWDPVDKNILWIATSIAGNNQDENNAKLIQFNIKTKNYKTYNHIAADPHSIASNCYGIYVDSLKRLLFNTVNGVAVYNRQSDNFTNYILPVPGKPSTELVDITTIAADKEGNVWIGGNFKGLFFLNTTTGIANFYAHTNETGSFPATKFGVNNLFFDRTGVLWILMPFDGIAWLDAKRSFFNAIKITAPLNDAGPSNGAMANYVCGKYSDTTFFVYSGKSIFTWNYTNNNFKKIKGADDNMVSARRTAMVDNDGLVWITSKGGGLFCYNPINGSLKTYKNNPKDSTSIGADYTTQIIQGNDDNMWIGTDGNGLNSFNKKTGKFTHYPFIINDVTIKANNVLDDKRIISLLCDKEGIIWIGTNLGALNRFDPKTGKFTSYLNTKEGFTCVISIFEDSHNRLWAGTYLSGLFLADRNGGFLKHFTEADGLSSHDIRGITEDKKGNIWLATSQGLSKLDPVTNKIINYSTINGLPTVQTEGIYKGTDGMFYLSIKNGIIPFDPNNIAENKVPPQVVIESVKYHTSIDNRDSVLFIDGQQQASFRYNENKISFQYVALHFSNALLNQYAYQLEGYDKDWIAAGTSRTVTYTNLSPGNYTFKIKAANSDGIWNETGASFSFTILPPWWKTWWAYLLYAVLFIAAISSYIAYRSIALKRENKVLEDKVALRTSQLQKSIQELKSTQSQLVQSEKMASLGELTAGIAHEIQNPLNFVNNFSDVNKELLAEMNDEIDKGNYDEVKALAKDVTDNEDKINYHGKRADAIVKGMLQHSRSSNGQKEPTDINALADEYLRLAYHGLRAKDKSFNVTLKTDFDTSIGNINIIPQDIGRVILNLITNAFYVVDEKKKSPLTPKGGTENPQGKDYEPTVTVSTALIRPLGGRGATIEIKVADNGNGIPQNILEKIFQPFFTTKPTGQGTGLGLSLSYDIVKAHGGELKVETKEGNGTEFIIQLPA